MEKLKVYNGLSEPRPKVVLKVLDRQRFNKGLSERTRQFLQPLELKVALRHAFHFADCTRQFHYKFKKKLRLKYSFAEKWQNDKTSGSKKELRRLNIYKYSCCFNLTGTPKY